MGMDQHWAPQQWVITKNWLKSAVPLVLIFDPSPYLWHIYDMTDLFLVGSIAIQTIWLREPSQLQPSVLLFRSSCSSCQGRVAPLATYPILDSCFQVMQDAFGQWFTWSSWVRDTGGGCRPPARTNLEVKTNEYAMTSQLPACVSLSLVTQYGPGFFEWNLLNRTSLWFQPIPI